MTEAEEARRLMRETLIHKSAECRELKAQRDHYRGVLNRLLDLLVERHPLATEELLGELRAEGKVNEWTRAA
jgi:hypothetical protein